MSGLLEAEISAPRLHLRPSRNQLGVGLVAHVRGVQLPQVPPGDLDVAFSVRYEPSDATIRASRPEILALRWPAVPPETLRMFEQVLLRATREAVAELVLYRVAPRDVALAETMGFEPGRLTVVEDGLVVHFVPRTRP